MVARVAAAGDADPLAVLDPGRDVDGELDRLDRAPAPASTRGTASRGLAVAAATIAGRRADDLAERGPRDRPQLTGALALRAGLDRGARLGAVAVAVLAARATAS